MAFLRLSLRWIKNDYLKSSIVVGVLGFGLLQDGDVGIGGLTCLALSPAAVMASPSPARRFRRYWHFSRKGLTHRG